MTPRTPPPPPVQQSFNVTKGTQTITFAPLADRALSAGAFVVAATASTGFTVTFTTTTPVVCTASGTNGSTITLVTSGTCTVKADQGGNSIFDPAPSVTQSFSVTKGAQAITFGTLSDKSIVQSPVIVSATSTSLLPVTFTTTTPGVCTAGGSNGATITLVSAGTCTVQADQAGDSTFGAAPPVQRSFNVNRVQQSITFGVLAGRTTLQTPVTVSATSSSGLTVTFTTTTPTVCSSGGTDGATITLLGAGTCTVQAEQAGNAAYTPATPVAQSFTVTKVDQTITFAALSDRTALQSPLLVSATASSTLTATFTTTTPSVCTAGGTDGATITLVAVGICTVEADQAGNATYNAAPPVARSFTVTKADQTITFGALTDVPLGPPITVGATASSGLPVAFSTTTPGVCTASGTTVDAPHRRHVHRSSRPSRRCAVQRRAGGGAELRRRQDEPDDHVRRTARRVGDARADHGCRDGLVGAPGDVHHHNTLGVHRGRRERRHDHDRRRRYVHRCRRSAGKRHLQRGAERDARASR